MKLFGKKKETKSCCCGGNCTSETMQNAENKKQEHWKWLPKPATPKLWKITKKQSKNSKAENNSFLCLIFHCSKQKKTKNSPDIGIITHNYGNKTIHLSGSVSAWKRKNGVLFTN